MDAGANRDENLDERGDLLPPPLEGIRIVDLSHFQAGPLASLMLSDMGAEVIKIEPPGRGDPMRRIGVYYLRGENTYFLSLNRNKKSVTVNLQHEEGRAIVLRLAQDADVMLENFRPGVVARLGLDYETVSRINPGIIYCSVSAFGQSGSLKHKPGIDPILQGFGGLMSITGYPDRPPAMVGAPVVDTAGAMLSAYAIMLALFARQRTGVGQKIEVSLLDSVLLLLTPREGPYFATGEVLQRWGNAHRQHVPHQAFEAQDGFLNVDVLDDGAWRRLCQVLERPDLAEDPRFVTIPQRVEHREELIGLLGPIFRNRPVDEWVQRLEAQEIICGPVNTFDKLFAHPEVQRMVVSMTHPTAGEVKMLGVPVKLGRTPGRPKSPPPLLGQHTQEVLAQAGYTAEQIADLRHRGII